jgi:hypothetical protein
LVQALQRPAGMSEPLTPTSPSLSSFERRIRGARVLALGAALASLAAVALGVIALRTPSITRVTPAAAPVLPSKLDELTVGRLNVVEPDGTSRMILASRARFPGSFIRGKEIARPDRRALAGILFVNDEGTENGGLVQGGELDATGAVQAALSLTFDRFRQDQMIHLELSEHGDTATAGLQINDRPSYQVFSIDDLLQASKELDALAPADKAAAVQRHQALGHLGAPRGYFGTRDGSSKLVLSDPQGRPRLRLSVSERGEPLIELLDDAGRALRTIDARTR